MIWCCHLLFIWISAVRQCVYPMMRCGALAINQVKLVMSCLLSVWSTVVGCLNWPGRWATVIDTIIDGYRLSFPCSRFYQTALAQQEHHPNARPNKLSIQCVCARSLLFIGVWFAIHAWCRMVLRYAPFLLTFSAMKFQLCCYWYCRGSLSDLSSVVLQRMHRWLPQHSASACNFGCVVARWGNGIALV